MILFAALTLGYTSCDYLDVVPKSKATENDIWKTPAEAKKFRFNMMQYMPVLFSYTKSPDQFAGDDFMSGPRSTSYWFPGKSLHYNEENPSQTYFGYWAPVARTNGTNYDLFRGIRYAYYFIDNIHNVKGLDASAASRYEGEAWFMIGYYHQTLLDYYGPTVLIKRFIPFDTDDKNEMFPSRRPVDECVDFIAECYDKAAGLLPESVIEQEWGTPSKATALAYKARLFLWAASPLVNGNPDMVDFKNPDGTQLVSTVSDRENGNVPWMPVRKPSSKRKRTTPFTPQTRSRDQTSRRKGRIITTMHSRGKTGTARNILWPKATRQKSGTSSFAPLHAPCRMTR